MPHLPARALPPLGFSFLICGVWVYSHLFPQCKGLVLCQHLAGPLSHPPPPLQTIWSLWASSCYSSFLSRP